MLYLTGDKIKVAYSHGDELLVMAEFNGLIYTYDNEFNYFVLEARDMDEIVELDLNGTPKEAQLHVKKCRELYANLEGLTLVKGTCTVDFVTYVNSNDISSNAMNIVDSDNLILKTLNEDLPSGFYATKDVHVINHERVV